jgi:hypothetical protein
MPNPSLTVDGRVHYRSHGSADGTYPATCRAAIITEVGQWVTVETSTPNSFDRSEGRPIRNLEQWWFSDALALAVINPTGVFFSGAAGQPCRYDPEHGAGGTWHWPADCGAQPGEPTESRATRPGT